MHRWYIRQHSVWILLCCNPSQWLLKIDRWIWLLNNERWKRCLEVPRRHSTFRHLFQCWMKWLILVMILPWNGKHWVNCQITGVHLYSWPINATCVNMCGSKTVHTNYTIVWFMGLDIVHVDHDDVIKWRHFPRYWPFVRGIHRSLVNSPHQGQWRGALIFSLICGWISAWVNNGEAGDLRRHRVHYDVIVM